MDDDSDVGDLISAGSAITGATFGTVVGSLGGPPGALLGAALGTLLGTSVGHIGKEIRGRHLAPREEARVGAALAFAVQAATERAASGEVPRTDDAFFEVPLGDRCAADEIVEGVFLGAQREYEERKVQLYGELLAGIAFRADVTRPHANYLIRVFEGLSFRQICGLAVAAKDGVGAGDYNGIALEDARVSEMRDLGTRGLTREREDQHGIYDLWSNGVLLFELLRLDQTVSPEEIARVFSIHFVRGVTDVAGVTDTVAHFGGGGAFEAEA